MLLLISSEVTKIGEVKLQEMMEANTSSLTDKSCVTVDTLDITVWILIQQTIVV